MGILRIVFWGVFFFFYLFSFENISVIHVLLGAELTSFPIPLLEWPFFHIRSINFAEETIKRVHILLLPGTN